MALVISNQRIIVTRIQKHSNINLSHHAPVTLYCAPVRCSFIDFALISAHIAGSRSTQPERRESNYRRQITCEQGSPTGTEAIRSVRYAIAGVYTPRTTERRPLLPGSTRAWTTGDFRQGRCDYT